MFFISEHTIYINKEEENENEFFGTNGRFLVPIGERNQINSMDIFSVNRSLDTI